VNKLKAIFTNKDVLKKMGITILILLAFRILVWVPIPLIECTELNWLY